MRRIHAYEVHLARWLLRVWAQDKPLREAHQLLHELDLLFQDQCPELVNTLEHSMLM